MMLIILPVQIEAWCAWGNDINPCFQTLLCVADQVLQAASCPSYAVKGSGVTGSTELVNFHFCQQSTFTLNIACVCHISLSWSLTVSGNWLLVIDGVHSLVKTRGGRQIDEFWDAGMEFGVRLIEKLAKTETNR